VNSEEDICKALIDALRGWSWKWDDRFGAVLAEFGVADQGEVRDVLRRLFSGEWDGSTIEAAPQAVQTVKSHFNGLMPGQMLFTSQPDREDFVYCAWWPWSNGTTISLRVAPFPGTSPGPERIARFKARFGL
jgi:hypothetical protein